MLINELGTNAIKHAFPSGRGCVVMSVEQVDGQIELTVADDGVGMKDKDSAAPLEMRGSHYVDIFVRQLGGEITVSDAPGGGTIVRVRLPSLLSDGGLDSPAYRSGVRMA